MSTSKDLDSTQILIAEFQYAAQTAQQANDDRGKVFELFLANIVTIISAALIPALSDTGNRYIYILIFLGIFLFGLITLLQLIKTRVAWRSSVLAMNQIKDFFIENSKELDLKKAFKWRTKSIPLANSKWSVIFFQGIAVMILNSVNVTTIFYLLAFQGFRLLYIPFLAIVFVISFIIHICIWEITFKRG